MKTMDQECLAGLEHEIDMLAQAVHSAEHLPPRRWFAKWGALPTDNMPKEFHPLVSDYKFIRDQIASQVTRRRSKSASNDVRFHLAC